MLFSHLISLAALLGLVSADHLVSKNSSCGDQLADVYLALALPWHPKVYDTQQLRVYRQPDHRERQLRLQPS